MRHAVIIAGGSGTRLWPMSRAHRPKQLLPFLEGGASLLDVAWRRLEGLAAPGGRYICAGRQHQAAILDAMDGLDQAHYLCEPVGRDTLNAVGFAAAVIGREDPDAVIGVFTADHIIEPVDQFQRIVTQGYDLAESESDVLVTFGITPSHAATSYGYLQLGAPIGDTARCVDQFREKPDEQTARAYVDAGADRYLWNSGMFVWRARTLLACIERYRPATHEGLMRIAEAWETPERDGVAAEVYPALPRISVDFAVMEPASKDPAVTVAAVPMPVAWLDVGSWPALAKAYPADENGNVVTHQNAILLDTRRTIVASDDPGHVVTTIGCDNLIVIHTPDATLVCHAGHAEQIKTLHEEVKRRFGDERT